VRTQFALQSFLAFQFLSLLPHMNIHKRAVGRGQRREIADPAKVVATISAEVTSDPTLEPPAVSHHGEVRPSLRAREVSEVEGLIEGWITHAADNFSVQ
jgi:hypothetical protein